MPFFSIGTSFVNIAPGGFWRAVECSSDCSTIIAGDVGNSLYKTTNYGANWTELTGAGKAEWRAIGCDATCTTIAAVGNNTYIKISYDSGATWQERVFY